MGQWGGGSLKIKDHFLLPRNSFLSHGVKLYSRAINKPCWGKGWWPEIPDCKVHSAQGGRSYRALPRAGQEKNRGMEQLLATLPHRGCTKQTTVEHRSPPQWLVTATDGAATTCHPPCQAFDTPYLI